MAGVPRQLAASATAASVATIAAVAVAALLAPGAAAAGLTTDDVLGRSVAECSTIRAFHPDDVYAYLCFYSAAVAGEFEAARAALDAVLDADPAEPRAALYAGLLAVAANEDRAEPLLRVSAAGFEREADARGEVWARISLGWNLYHRGRPAEGQAEIERALAVARASAEPMLVAEAEVSVGWLHQNAWRHSDAFAAFRSAARVLLPDGPAHLRVRLLDGLGATAWALGRYEDALEYYRQHLATIGLADPAGEALVLANMTLVARRLAIEGRLSEDERLDYERRTLDAALRAGDRKAEARARVMLAESLEDEEGYAHAERALALARSIGDRSVLTWALWVLAEAEARRGPAGVARALELVAEGEALALEAADPESIARARLVRSVIRWNDGDRAGAIRDALGALDWIERIREHQSDLEGRARVFSRFAHAYRRAAAILLDPSAGRVEAEDVERAFAVMERLRARLLLDRIDSAGIAPAAAALTPPTSDEVRARLAPDQAVISYRMPVTRRATGSAFVLTRERLQVVELPGLGDLDREVTTYQALLERRDAASAPGAARLHELLLEEPLRRLGPDVRRIVIVPDGTLHRLPFGSLEGRDGTGPLGLHRELTIAPSHAAWLRWRLEPAPVPRDALLALADPRVASVVPDTELRSPAPRGRLPHARIEARRVRSALGGASRILAGAAADEATLRRLDPARFRVLHFATHAVVDERDPARSAVVLAPGEGEDGLLEFREIVDLDLRGPVVVLSACRSASGPVLGGDGPMGLAQAFFLGGSSTVVASLWPLGDAEASELFGRFASGLARGLSVAGALAAAQRGIAARGAPPAAWAGVVVLGDGDRVPFPGTPVPRPGASALAALVGAGLGAALLAAKFSRRA